jgi:hypothetical protein
MSNIDEILSQVAVNPDFLTDNAIAIVQDVEIVSFSSEAALLFVVFGERAPLSSPLRRTHTVVLKTSDGGNSWRLTLNATRGKLVKEEIFFLDENHGWFLTQWQIAGSFPTLYQTDDFGSSWQEFTQIHDVVTAQGALASFSEARELRFQSKQEGIVIGQSFNANGEAIHFFLKTTDAGKTWQTIPTIPIKYFTAKSQHADPFTFPHPWRVAATTSGFSVQRLVGEFATAYPASNGNG